jgi:succinoglycan biosynthesis protein ExoA
MTSNETTEFKETLIIIPCLNEEAHIGHLLEWLIGEYAKKGATIVAVDGGSTDSTIIIIKDIASRNACLKYIHNPKKLQSAAVNLAVNEYGEGKKYLIRIDAHSQYPNDYCAKLVEEVNNVDCDSVTVSMMSIGEDGFQMLAALAQNSKLGNGGSVHRLLSQGQYVDHGHHALIKIEAFKAVGGYDETYSHNEDAELDIRLRKAGYKIWHTAATFIEYFPRDNPARLFRQYMSYGKGRAKSYLKHKYKLKLRQLLPIMVFPAAVLAFVAAFTYNILALPFILWLLASVLLALDLAIKLKRIAGFFALLPAVIMHFAWSFGFWAGLVIEKLGHDKK